MSVTRDGVEHEDVMRRPTSDMLVTNTKTNTKTSSSAMAERPRCRVG